MQYPMRVARGLRRRGESRGSGAAAGQTRGVVMLLSVLVLVLTGCGNAVISGKSTALSGFDLEAMTDQMAAGIMADPEVRAAAANGPLKVVVLPVENLLTGEVLPEGQARAFTARVRVLLARARTGRFTWINNRDTFYALRNRELEGVDPGPDPDAISPEYALHATFRSLASDDKHARSAFYQCVFTLTSLDNRTELWTDVYNVRKTAVKNFLD